MSHHIIDVLAEGFKWTFHDPDHFRKWLRKREVNAGDIYIRGVPGRNHSGSTEVADFLAKELRLPKPLYKWKNRKLVYAQKRCGHRPREEGVDCELSSRNFEVQPQLSSSGEQGDPVAPAHGKPEASILFSQTTILNGDGAILCENPGDVRVYKEVRPPTGFNERAPVAVSRACRHPT